MKAVLFLAELGASITERVMRSSVYSLQHEFDGVYGSARKREEAAQFPQHRQRAGICL